MSRRRVVITGMSVVTALATDLTTFWRRLCAGQSCIGPVHAFDASDLKTRIAGEITNFDPTAFIDARELKRMARFTTFALIAAEAAMSDSGVELGGINPFRSGVIVGTGIGGQIELEEAFQKMMLAERISPLTIPKAMLNAAAGQISIRFGFRGPNSTVAMACASSTNAIGDAFKAIQRGAAELMITGGAEAPITRMGITNFSAMRALSERNDTPEQASRPFDKNRDGFVLSEGAGILVLEDYDHARRRDAKIYAEVIGFGSTSDGLHITAPDPTGWGAANAMSSALRDARLDATHVEYVNAHATGTSIGDKAETAAIKNVFAGHDELCVSSSKSQLGHMLGASGGVEAIITAMSLYQGVTPPTINLTEPDPECNLDCVPNYARDLPLKYAMTNSFGFGGHNSSLVLAALDGVPKRQLQAA